MFMEYIEDKNNNYYIISRFSEIIVLIMEMTTTINILPIPNIMPQQFLYISQSLVSLEASFYNYIFKCT